MKLIKYILAINLAQGFFEYIITPFMVTEFIVTLRDDGSLDNAVDAFQFDWFGGILIRVWFLLQRLLITFLPYLFMFFVLSRFIKVLRNYHFALLHVGLNFLLIYSVHLFLNNQVPFIYGSIISSLFVGILILVLPFFKQIEL